MVVIGLFPGERNKALTKPNKYTTKVQFLESLWKVEKGLEQLGESDKVGEGGRKLEVTGLLTAA